MVTLLPSYCPEGSQLPMIMFQQCLEGCWDHRRLLQKSWLTVHQLELTQIWDKKRPLSSLPLPSFISALSTAKVEELHTSQVSKLMSDTQPSYLFQWHWLPVHSQWLPVPDICGAQLMSLMISLEPVVCLLRHSKFKFAYHKNKGQGSSEELKLSVSAATEWNRRWKQHICRWDCSNHHHPTEPGLFPCWPGLPRKPA